MRSPAPAAPTGGARIDLHLHSRASTDTGSWFLNRAVLPESYTEPALAYATAKRRGMDLVALTDHNTISGALEIAHHPDVLIGVEVTAAFPEDRVPVHVLVWGVDEPRWADMDRLRDNLYELLDYLDAAGLPCALAHPLHRVGAELTADHVERCLLLFRLWEGRNGSRPAATNQVAARIAASARPDLLDRLADKHGISPRGRGAPALTGGSDDHGAFDIGMTWTAMPAVRGPRDALDHLRAGRVEPGGQHGDPAALAHSVGSLAAKAYLERGTAAVPDQLRGLVGDLLQYPLPPAAGPVPPGASGIAQDVLGRIRGDRRLVRRYRRLSRIPEGGARSHARLRLVSGWLHEELVRRALDPRGLSLGSVGRRLEALAGAGALALPYLLAANYARGEVRYAEGVEREFFGPTVAAPGPVPAVMLTDTFAELNGVAGTMRRLAAFARVHEGAGISVITCGAGADDPPVHRDLTPVARLPVPAYGDASWRLGVPSVIDVLDAVEATGARVVHAATPGPMGLAGLVVARTLGLPFVASHNTELARYALELTGDRLAAQLADRALRWFYGQAERVYVPTRAAAEGIVAAGVAPARVLHVLARHGPGPLRSRAALARHAPPAGRAPGHHPDLRGAPVAREGPRRAGRGLPAGVGQPPRPAPGDRRRRAGPAGGRPGPGGHPPPVGGPTARRRPGRGLRLRRHLLPALRDRDLRAGGHRGRRLGPAGRRRRPGGRRRAGGSRGHRAGGRRRRRRCAGRQPSPCCTTCPRCGRRWAPPRARRRSRGRRGTRCSPTWPPAIATWWTRTTWPPRRGPP